MMSILFVVLALLSIIISVGWMITDGYHMTHQKFRDNAFGKQELTQEELKTKLKTLFVYLQTVSDKDRVRNGYRIKIMPSGETPNKRIWQIPYIVIIDNNIHIAFAFDEFGKLITKVTYPKTLTTLQYMIVRWGDNVAQFGLYLSSGKPTEEQVKRIVEKYKNYVLRDIL